MKNKLIKFGLVAVAIATFGLYGEGLNRYSLNATVYAVDGSEVFFEDSKGDIWSIYDEGYEVGEKVVLKMHTNYTDSKYDDRIVKVKTA